MLASAEQRQQNTPASIGHLEQALKQWPDNPVANNNLAWLLATSPDEKLVDGKRAVELAERAGRSQPTLGAFQLGTLAAALAAAGRWPEAQSKAQQALELSAAEKNEKASRDLAEQLRKYQSQQRHIESP